MTSNGITKGKTMPYNNIADGLYLAQQPGIKAKGIPVTHFGIIDIGNVLENPNVNSRKGPTVIHQTPPEVRCEYVSAERPWSITHQITDIHAAKSRIANAVKNKAYDLFGNNCEHFARYIATDKKYSGQVVIGTIATASVIALAVHLLWPVGKKHSSVD
jgi:hypothetical protein